jgi:hypothetical protein
MFDEKDLKAAVEIQRRSYRLLRWVEGAIQSGFIRLDRAHQYSSEADAAEAWVSEHFANLPPDCRPTDRTGQQFRRFATFFASYLLTSFDFDEKPGVRRVSSCGCYCPICTHLTAAPHLKPKKVRPRDKQRAEQLKRAYLEELAMENNVPFSAELESAVLNNSALRRDFALATYGKELLRRCNGQSSGPAVLALWRQFAWKPTGSADPKFELTASAILEAEQQVVSSILSGGLTLGVAEPS